MIKEEIKALIEMYETEVEDIEKIYGENLDELDPYDASGGNFDDAYQLGYEHGETYGKLVLLKHLLSSLES